jgi:dUTP pyrophosphatase
MEDIKQYLKELESLKNSGLLDDESITEIDSLVDELKDLEDKNITENSNNSDYEFNIPIKYVNLSENPDPLWAKKGDSGFDLRASLPNGEKKIVLQPFERMLIPTGLYFELPEIYELQIRPRSGHSFKTGLMAILGTVDTGYRGEVKVIMVNLDTKPQRIEQGERIAQGVVTTRVSTEYGKLIKLNSVDELSNSERGSGGFGSTGTK